MVNISDFFRFFPPVPSTFLEEKHTMTLLLFIFVKSVQAALFFCKSPFIQVMDKKNSLHLLQSLGIFDTSGYKVRVKLFVSVISEGYNVCGTCAQ